MLVYIGTAGYLVECVKGSIGLLQHSLSFEELFSYSGYGVRSHRWPRNCLRVLCSCLLPSSSFASPSLHLVFVSLLT